VKDLSNSLINSNNFSYIWWS